MWCLVVSDASSVCLVDIYVGVLVREVKKRGTTTVPLSLPLYFYALILAVEDIVRKEGDREKERTCEREREEEVALEGKESKSECERASEGR